MPILQMIKNILVGTSQDDAFNLELLVYINATFGSLSALGVTELGSLDVDETTEWPELRGSVELLSLCKAYLVLRVKSTFDPSTNATVQQSYSRFESELELRIITHLKDLEEGESNA